jgi:hypothetical protein
MLEINNKNVFLKTIHLWTIMKIEITGIGAQFNPVYIGIEKLPDVLLPHIFKFLSSNDFFINLPLVTKKWHSVIKGSFEIKKQDILILNIIIKTHRDQASIMESKITQIRNNETILSSLFQNVRYYFGAETREMQLRRNLEFHLNNTRGVIGRLSQNKKEKFENIKIKLKTNSLAGL